MTFTELSLFTGAGGGVLGSILLGHRVVGYVENNEYCQKIIAQRIKDGFFDEAPIYGDIRDFNSQGYAESYKGLVDVVSGGFPCQPFSNAGKLQAENDARNMWPETAKTISIIKPQHVLLENVPGISKYLPVVVRDLRRIGYSVRRPAIIAAASMGAGHLRRRIWVYANFNEARQQNFNGEPTTKAERNIRGSACLENSETISSDTDREWKLQPQGDVKKQWEWVGDCGWWKAEPDMVRVVYGVPNGMDRIAALGNAQIPLMAATAWKILSGE